MTHNLANYNDDQFDEEGEADGAEDNEHDVADHFDADADDQAGAGDGDKYQHKHGDAASDNNEESYAPYGKSAEYNDEACESEDD